MTKLELKQALETILFVATHPLSPKQLTELIGDCETKEIRELVAELNLSYKKTNRIFRIDSVADGLQMHTLPEYKKWAQSLETVKVIKLSPAVMETLAIIAYKQPLTRAGIEFIRGVDSSHTIRRLMQQKLVRIVGREMLPGRPGLYGTTKGIPLIRQHVVGSGFAIGIKIKDEDGKSPFIIKGFQLGFTKILLKKLCWDLLVY